VSPGHRAALAFLQGALVAAVADLAGVPLASALGTVDFLAPAVGTVRTIVPILGLVLAGAMGGEAIGRRWAVGCASGGAVAGGLLSLTAPHLQGLTGFEDPVIVVGFSLGTSAAAYGLWGLTAGAIASRSIAWRAAGVFAFGGALGGLVTIVPFLVPRTASTLAGSAATQFVWLASALGGLAVPLAVGGALLAGAVSRSAHGE
jgi:hypothetical protein